MRKFLLVGAFMVLPVSAMGVVAAAGTAFAAKPAGTSVKCKNITGTITGNVSVTKCNDKANTGGSGSAPASSLISGSGKITWNGTGTTKLDNVVPTQAGTACPSGSTEYMVTGDVKGGTGAAKTSIPKGWTFTVNVCVDGSGNITMAPGSELLFSATA
ncbi:MAG: hypothetical protein WAM97_08595 [Acidimicrobiales bacterium]|jgi:hypothetical protein